MRECNGWLLLALLALTPVASPLFADDWPQWLGPQRDGVWREEGILDTFPDEGPKLRWKAEIGPGYSGPAVAGGRVVLMDRVAEPIDLKTAEVINQDDAPANPNIERRRIPGRERVVCFNEADGKRLWTHDYECDYTSAGPYTIGPRTTPVIENGRIYILGAEGHLACLRARNGRTIWSRELKQDFGVDPPLWGYASHLLIDAKKLIVMVGGATTTTVALQKRNGLELWWALSSSETGYAPPVLATFGGKRQLLIWHGEALNGLDPESGRLYWSVPVKAQYGMAIATPRVVGHDIYLMCFNRQSQLIRVGPTGEDAAMVWSGDTRRGIGGVLNTPFLLDGHVYACGPDGRYACARLSDGKVLWTTFQPATGERPATWANVFTVRQGNRFFLANDQGDLIIAGLTPGGYEERSRTHLIDPTHEVAGRKVVWSHPAFANRSIYLRNDAELRCYSLAAP